MIKDIFVVDNVVDIVDVSDACVAGIGSLLVAVAGVFNKNYFVAKGSTTLTTIVTKLERSANKIKLSPVQ